MSNYIQSRDANYLGTYAFIVDIMNFQFCLSNLFWIFQTPAKKIYFLYNWKIFNYFSEFFHNFPHFFPLYLFQTLVLAGLGDLSRPANQLSISQSASLFATGCIWSRYSLVIIPKNYSLFAVNVFVALIQLVQLTRAYKYSREHPAKPTTTTKN